MTGSVGSQGVIGITGWSGSGKTSLVIRLIPEFSDRGFRVATIKHAHHAFDIDTPGKDSYEHRAAGAVEVVISSTKRWAVMHENQSQAEPTLDELLVASPADIVLVEGFKNDAHAKIEVHRPSTGAELIAPPTIWSSLSPRTKMAGLSLPASQRHGTSPISSPNFAG